MPYIVSGENMNTITQSLKDIEGVRYEYKYPRDLDLRPGSDLHKRIVDEVLRRARESNETMSSRHPSWRKQDRMLTTYQYVDDVEKGIQDKDERKPVSIIFPYTYAVMETLLTYLVMTFFQDPIFEYEGVSPDDIIGGKLLTLLVRMHCDRNKVPLALHTMFRDSLAYGLAPTSPDWETREADVISHTTGSAYNIDGVEVAGEDIETTDRKIVFEGNSLDNIDPYKYLPDPNVASHKVQKGEYVGWWRQTDLMSLLTEEAKGEYFNVKYLKHLKNKLSFLNPDSSDRNKRSKKAKKDSSVTTTKTDSIVMYIYLIPSDWGLSQSNYPEKWWFEVSSDAIVIKAEKAEQRHGLYPVAVSSPDFDGYSPTPISRLEAVYGLQHTMDFLFNSHIANVRKAINDMLVIDPWMININDVKDPKAGKLIRLRRPAWGKGKVTDHIGQLAINDITRNNLSDSNYIASWMQKLTAADDNMTGALRTSGPERLTKAEYQGTRGNAFSRVSKLAKITSLQAMQDIAYFFASHAQQYITQETWVRVLGDLPEQLINEYGAQQSGGVTRLKVSPKDLNIVYDIIPRDGTLPGGSDVEAWIKLYQMSMENPMVAQEFDSVRIFTHIARELGATNVDQFRRNLNRIQPQRMPDEEVEKEVQKGNLIPSGGV